MKSTRLPCLRQRVRAAAACSPSAILLLEGVPARTSARLAAQPARYRQRLPRQPGQHHQRVFAINALQLVRAVRHATASSPNSRATAYGDKSSSFSRLSSIRVKALSRLFAEKL